MALPSLPRRTRHAPPAGLPTARTVEHGDGVNREPTDARLDNLPSKTLLGADAPGSAGVIRLGTGLSITSSTLNGQEVLVSGVNIKTINGSSLLGSGDLVVLGAEASLLRAVYLGA